MVQFEISLEHIVSYNVFFYNSLLSSDVFPPISLSALFAMNNRNIASTLYPYKQITLLRLIWLFKISLYCIVNVNFMYKSLRLTLLREILDDSCRNYKFWSMFVCSIYPREIKVKMNIWLLSEWNPQFVQ